MTVTMIRRIDVRTAADRCRNIDYATAPGNIEYGTDTTRAIIGVTFNGDTTRYPDIKFIWSHAGVSAYSMAGCASASTSGRSVSCPIAASAAAPSDTTIAEVAGTRRRSMRAC
jgi:hypothetical protein